MTDTENNEFNLNMKTSISTEKPVFDIHDNYLPYGNFFLTINSFTPHGTAIGTIKIGRDIKKYEFKNFTIIRMMAKSQARLHRRANIFHSDMPDNPSPSHVPSIVNNFVLSSGSPRIRSRLSPASITTSSELSPPSLSPGLNGVTDRKISTSTDSSESDDPCTICFDGKPNYLLPCNHSFHLGCITQWENRNHRIKPFKCPNCNQPYSVRFGRRFKI